MDGPEKAGSEVFQDPCSKAEINEVTRCICMNIFCYKHLIVYKAEKV